MQAQQHIVTEVESTESPEPSPYTNLLLAVIKGAWQDASNFLKLDYEKIDADTAFQAASAAEFFLGPLFQRFIRVIEVDCNSKVVTTAARAIGQAVLAKLGVDLADVAAPHATWMKGYDMLQRNKTNHVWKAAQDRFSAPAFELVSYSPVAA